jgi:hypothetical protein
MLATTADRPKTAAGRTRAAGRHDLAVAWLCAYALGSGVKGIATRLLDGGALTLRGAHADEGPVAAPPPSPATTSGRSFPQRPHHPRLRG